MPSFEDVFGADAYVPPAFRSDPNDSDDPDNDSDNDNDTDDEIWQPVGPPRIDLTDMQERDALRLAWNAVNDRNFVIGPDDKWEPDLFRSQMDTLSRVAYTQEGAVVQAYNANSMRQVLIETIDWTKSVGKGDNKRPVASTCPQSLPKMMLATPSEYVPRLRRVSNVPVITHHGTVLLRKGYYPDCEIYIDPVSGLHQLDVPECPTEEHVETSLEVFTDDLLVDFPFAAESDLTHAIAMFITPYMREIIDDPMPLFLVEAAKQGTGKGKLITLVNEITLGTTGGRLAVGSDASEIHRFLTGRFLAGVPLVALDNIEELSSPTLASALTERFWDARLVGTSDSRSIPIKVCWMASGNNPRLSGEIARRTVRVRLESPLEEPWLRKDFKHPNLMEWMRVHRGAIVRAVLTLIRHWYVQGQVPYKKTTLGSYERWCEIVGGVLQAVGRGDSFLAKQDELYEEADLETEQWKDFIEAWAIAQKEREVAPDNTWVEVGELLEVIADNDLLLESVTLQRTLQGQKIALAKKLQAQRDAVVSGCTVCRRRHPATRRRQFCLRFQAPKGPEGRPKGR